MALIFTYNWSFIRYVDVDGPSTNFDAATLANGGFAAMGDHGTHNDGGVFTMAASLSTGWDNVAGTFGALSQLSNGNIVAVTSNGTFGIDARISSSLNGAEVVPNTTILDLLDVFPDVAGLNSGFCVVNQRGTPDFIGFSYRTIMVTFYDNNANLTNSIAITDATSQNFGASVARMDDNNVAVAWTRQIGANTQVWYAICNPVTGEVEPPTRLDNIGAINRDVSVSAKTGGFAIAYEDNEYGATGITLAQFDYDGLLQRLDEVAGTSANDANPSLSRMSNGMLAVSFTDSTYGAGDNDTILKLIDPSTGDAVATRYVTGGESVADDTENSTIAGYGLGRLAAFHSNITDFDADGEALQAVRTTNGDGADDTFLGDDFVDIVNGGGGNDHLHGGGNDDTINGGADGDVLDGGSGIDTVTYAGSGAVRVSLALGGAQNTGGSGLDTVLLFENLVGSSFDDDLTGDTGANIITGAAGRDIIRGGAGSDTIYGGDETGAGDILLAGDAGNDVILGGAGNDRIEGGADIDPGLNGNGGEDTIYGGSEDDRIDGGADNDVWLGGDAGVDYIYGGPGNDRIDGGADGDTWLGGDAGIDTITGGSGNDRIDGGADNDTWLGGDAGADIVTGGPGNDRIDGGTDGDIWLGGDAGIDYITGGDSGDRADGGSENDTINGGGGADHVTGASGDDTITGGDEAGPGDIWLGGDAGIDYIYGGLGNDRLDGGGDGDTLNGQDGADTITGGLGNDYLYGGAGIDYLEGGAANDQMTGGADADTFDFNPGTGLDSVLDFANDIDTLRIDAGFGFANVAAVLARTIQSGNHARILLNAAGTDSVYLLNYLTPGNGNTIANLGDGISIA